MLIRSRRYSRLFLILLLVLATTVLVLASREDDYIRRDAGRFRIIYCPEDAEVVEDLLKVMSIRIPVVEKQLGLSLQDSVTIIVTPSEQEWYRVSGGVPSWANGIAYSSQGVTVLKSPRFGQPFGPLPKTAIHEYVHLLLESGAPEMAVPRWLTEGLAQVLADQMSYMDTRTLSRAAVSGRIHTLWQIEGMMSMSAAEARQAYAESMIAVELLRDKFGFGGISNCVYALRSGQNIEEIFPKLFGMSLGSFEREYQSHIQRTYGNVWIAFSELWISGLFVILVFAAGFGVYLRRRRTLNRWQAEASGEQEVHEPPYTINYTVVRNRLSDRGSQEESED